MVVSLLVTSPIKGITANEPKVGTQWETLLAHEEIVCLNDIYTMLNLNI